LLRTLDEIAAGPLAATLTHDRADRIMARQPLAAGPVSVCDADL